MCNISKCSQTLPPCGELLQRYQTQDGKATQKGNSECSTCCEGEEGKNVTNHVKLVHQGWCSRSSVRVGEGGMRWKLDIRGVNSRLKAAAECHHGGTKNMSRHCVLSVKAWQGWKNPTYQYAGRLTPGNASLSQVIHSQNDWPVWRLLHLSRWINFSAASMC